MSEKKVRGETVGDEQIQAWADEARAAMPSAPCGVVGAQRGRRPGIVVPVRLDARTLEALTERARAEGLANRSEAIRAAVRAWTHVA
ncbi:ribbon-helix-helix domain-containing protein [Oerskovia sp. M15]